MNRCLVCNEVIEDNFNSLFCEKQKICYRCYKKFNVRNTLFYIEGAQCLILYYYNEFFKDVLYRYKGCYDYELKDCFLTYNLNYLKRKYRGYSVVLAPSFLEDENKRGFNHLQEIFKKLDLPIIKCFKKSKNWKQSSKNKEERKGVQNIIKIDKTRIKGVKRMLVVDDVLTSGSTIKTMLRQLPTNIDKKVLVLSSNCRVLSNEIV